MPIKETLADNAPQSSNENSRWRVAHVLGKLEIVTEGPAITCKLICSNVDPAFAELIAAAPDLLAYAECSAAMDCDRADPAFDPQPVLRRHGWNGEENPGVFLARIRRDALKKAVGHYLGRRAAA